MSMPERKIVKVDDSFSVTIPNELLEKSGLKHGDDTQLEIVDGSIRISKSQKVTLS